MRTEVSDLDAHTVSDADAGRSHAVSDADAGTPSTTLDAAASDDAAATDTAEPCTSSLGWRRCTRECRTCPAGHCCGLGYECHSPSEVCFPGRGVNSCRLARAPTSDREPYEPACPDGKACFFEGRALPDGDERGTCVPAEICMLDEGEIGPHRCFWGTGEEVSRIPDRSCRGLAWACGAGSDCAHCSGPCVGPSDDRGLGICTHTMTNTCAGDGGEIDRLVCQGLSWPPCSCMMAAAPASTTERPFGFVVDRASCATYEAMFPGEVVCVDIPSS